MLDLTWRDVILGTCSLMLLSSIGIAVIALVLIRGKSHDEDDDPEMRRTKSQRHVSQKNEGKDGEDTGK
jgi:hypothetical protein